jgi:hypothetical protein
MRELHARAHVQEQPFTSDKPFIGGLIVRVREAWNSVATRWYVRPMVHQQNLFNQTVIHMFRELVELNKQLEEMNQRLAQVEEWLISGDKDLTTLAHQVAEGEHRMRQWQRQAVEARDDLARQLSRLEKPDEKGKGA